MDYYSCWGTSELIEECNRLNAENKKLREELERLKDERKDNSNT